VWPPRGGGGGGGGGTPFLGCGPGRSVMDRQGSVPLFIVHPFIVRRQAVILRNGLMEKAVVSKAPRAGSGVPDYVLITSRIL